MNHSESPDSMDTNFKDAISIDDFIKLDIRIGTVTAATQVPETDKLLQLVVDFGDHNRQIVSGIAEHIDPEYLVGQQCLFIINLAPRMIRGVESNGMILAIGGNGQLALLHPHQPVSNGSVIR